MKVEGVCKLCNEKRILVKGHIYPKFIKRSIDNKINAMGGSAKNHYYESENTKNPYQKNKQDWPKGYLFCHECDNEKLSKMERDFNEECFISIIKGTFKLSEKNFPIIFRFSVSIVFRVLIYITTSNKKK